MIRVLHNYGGRNTNERRILPGDYHSADEQLFGLAKYLVANGHAVVLSEDTVIKPEMDAPEALEALHGSVPDISDVDKPKGKRK